jgi:secreted PhoX family phosphatase
MPSRRQFLRNAAAVTVGFSGLQTFIACQEYRSPQSNRLPVGPYGPLVADPSGILDLPAGFSYRVISEAGDLMDDGFYVPGAHDGMAAFPAADNRVILVRNHEVNVGRPHKVGPFGDDGSLVSQIDPAKVYDLGESGTPALGGTTTLVFNTKTQELESHYLSLTGTLRNCAGGPTPWNSWLTCEETTVRAGNGLLVDHGYVFEVPASLDVGLADPVPLKAMGRFNHEAVAVDPESGVVYLTEDRGDGLIYRFIPSDPGHLVAGGHLQALMVVDSPGLDTRNWETATVSIGQTFDVAWIDLDEIDAPRDDLRIRGFEAGAALFARGEGMWYGNNGVYFACTKGGSNESGQVWKYVPSPAEGTSEELSQPGRLELFIEPNDGAIVQSCDNLTVAPWGDLVLCEDRSDGARLITVTPEGECSDFARNSYTESELAGATFSPDGSTLFVNLQGEGRTMAIAGPFV